MRIPRSDEHAEFSQFLDHAERLRTQAISLVESLADIKTPERGGDSTHSVFVPTASDTHSPQDFLLRTPLGTVTARFELSFIPRVINGEDLGTFLSGVYKFFITKFDEEDKPVTSQICRIYFDLVSFRYGSDTSGYGVLRDIKDNFAHTVLAFVLANLVDHIDRPGGAQII